MSLPRRVQVSGPLEPYAVGFRTELERLGYSPWSVVFALQSLAGLSRWVVARNLCPSDLTPAELDVFVHEWRGSDTRRTTPRGLAALLMYLRELRVIPAVPLFVPGDRLARLLDEFALFLVEQRGLAHATVWYYRATACRFLQSIALGDDAGLPQLSVSAVRSFLITVLRLS